MKNNYLPDGDDQLVSDSNYLQISKLQDGEYKFRIVQKPIAGWKDWMGNKPFRFRPENKPAKSFDPDKKVKRFWAMHVWSYEQERLVLMEITQVGVINSLREYAGSEDWGDLTTFDIKIKKQGSGIDTEYAVIPFLPRTRNDCRRSSNVWRTPRLAAMSSGTWAFPPARPTLCCGRFRTCMPKLCW